MQHLSTFPMSQTLNAVPLPVVPASSPPVPEQPVCNSSRFVSFPPNSSLIFLAHLTTHHAPQSTTTYSRDPKMPFSTGFSATLCLALVLAAGQRALAVNDWSVPCTQGQCSWDLPDDSAASGTVHIVSLRFTCAKHVAFLDPSLT